VRDAVPAVELADCTSGEINSGTAAANAIPNQTVGGHSSHEMTPSIATPARLPARLIV
jgi:hypothetical protein